MKIARLSAGPTTGDGAISSAYLFDPTNPANAKLPGVKLYHTILKRHLPNADPTAVAHLYGMAVAYVMVDVLKRAGRNPTRESVLRAATHLKLTRNPFMLSDVKLQTTPANVFPIHTAHLVRFQNGFWRVQKALLKTSG
jgi:branched-chain amino acid transport system substrate-binding protein